MSKLSGIHHLPAVKAFEKAGFLMRDKVNTSP